MKKILVIASLLITTVIASAANADTMPTPAGVPAAAMSGPSMQASTPAPVSPASGMLSGGMGGNHPCKKIVEACQAAGYTKGMASSGKGLGENCMKPLLQGQPVPGVNIAPADVQACLSKHQQH